MRRAVLSCDQCRSRKVRCDRNLPCNQCLLRGAKCVWSEAEATSSPVLPVASSSVAALENQIDELHGIVELLGTALGLSSEQIRDMDTIARARDILALSPVASPFIREDAEMDEVDDTKRLLALPQLIPGQSSSDPRTSASPDPETEEAWTPDADLEHQLGLNEYPTLHKPTRTASSRTMNSMPPTPNGQYDDSPFFLSPEIAKTPKFTLERHWA